MVETISPRMSTGAVDRRDREIAALGARPVAEIAVLIFGGGVGRQLDVVDGEAGGGIAVLEADVVEHEEFGLGADIDGVADAGRLEIGLGALGGRARIAGVELAGAGIDDVAEQDDHRRRAERIDIPASRSGFRIMSDSLIAFQPAIEVPSNIRPSVSSSSPITPAHIVRCCHLPLGSVKRRSTHSISSSLIAFRILPASFAM